MTMKGKHHSEKTKQHWSEIRKGSASPNKGKKYPRELYPDYGMRGKKVSLESKVKMSAAKKGKHGNNNGKKYPKELYPNYGGRGRVVSKEQREKISFTLKKFHKDGYANSSKGKTIEEILGVEKAKLWRLKNSKGHKKLYENGYRNPQEGKKVSLETRQKQSASHKKLYANGYVHPMTGKQPTKDSRNKRSKTWRLKILNGYVSPMKGREFSTERKQKQSVTIKKLWENSDYKKRQIELILKGLIAAPNKSEQKLYSILKQNNLPYKYVGNGEVIIGYKNPDFINTNGEKKIIELFGVYWHGNFPNPEKRIKLEKERFDIFAKYGYKTLIIWEDELENIDGTISRIKEFEDSKCLHQ